MSPTPVDVVVVGAGVSGLCCAQALRRGGVDFVVLEGRDRVGGRTLTERFQGAQYDLGGTWVGPKQHHILRLLDDLGIEKVDQYCQGKKVLDFWGAVSTYKADIPSLGVLSLIDVQLALWRIAWMVRSMPKDDPWKHPRAAELDSMTAETFFKEQLWTNGAKALCESMVRAILGVEPADVSALHFLWYVSSSESIENLVETQGGNQHWTLKGGAQQISKRLQDLFPDRVHVNSPVGLIERRKDESVLVTTTNGAQFVCKRVVIAAPPALACKIQFAPPLPTPRRDLLERNFMGCIIKIFVFYDQAYWRLSGYSGEVLCDARDGPVFNVFDACKVSPEGRDVNALVLFVNGSPARVWSEADQPTRKAAVLKQLVRWFGKDMAHPIDYVEKDWTQDGGCPVAVNGPGLLRLSAAEIRKPCGPIHWGSTETANVSQGFLDGAVEAGYRVAAEVQAELKRGHSKASL